MAAKTIPLRKFEAEVRSWRCSIVKTAKEWEIVDDTDGSWITGFATVSGRAVKLPYLKLFLKLIKEKRGSK